MNKVVADDYRTNHRISYLKWEKKGYFLPTSLCRNSLYSICDGVGGVEGEVEPSTLGEHGARFFNMSFYLILPRSPKRSNCYCYFKE